MTRSSALAFAAACILCAAPGFALAAGNAALGLALAQRWCNSCHVVLQHDPSWDDGEIGPRFSTLTATTSNQLSTLFAKNHADMDALAKLTDGEIADIVAHLQSLKPEPR